MKKLARLAWACKHTDRKHAATGLCAACYGTARRKARGARVGFKGAAPKFATACSHPERRQLAKGLCASCYNSERKRLVPSTCHPTRPVSSRGLCNACYKKALAQEPGHIDKRKAWQREWARRHPERVKAQARKTHLRRVYKLTPEQVEAMKVAQQHRCAVCQRDNVKLCVDHNHATGHVRALLCHGCNTIIGAIERAGPGHYRYLGGSWREGAL